MKKEDVFKLFGIDDLRDLRSGVINKGLFEASVSS